MKDGGNHAAAITASAKTIEACKAIAATGIRVVIDDELLAQLFKLEGLQTRDYQPRLYVSLGAERLRGGSSVGRGILTGLSTKFSQPF